jgi:TldD protein
MVPYYKRWGLSDGMNDLAEMSVSAAEEAGAEYAEFRWEEVRTEDMRVRNGVVESVSQARTEGFGVRVLRRGAWGFAASPRVHRREVMRVTKQALSVAAASARVHSQEVKLDDSLLATTGYETPIAEDPLAVNLSEKAGILTSAHAEMAQVAGIAVTEGYLNFRRRQMTLFASGMKRPLTQTIVVSGGGMECIATDGAEIQRRSYPQAHGGNVATAGFEFIRELDLPGNARRIADEAALLLKSDPTPEGETTLVVGSSQLALQIHESVGHATELDRIFGYEISFAGGSWVEPSDIGSLRYGSEQMNIIVDATSPRGLGTFGFDDEGIPAKTYCMVDKGILKYALSSRETARKLGKWSTGAMRADGWNRIPLVRMTNVSLVPGNLPLEALLSDIDSGIFVDVNKSWSIDDRRLNFQFATEYAREIRKGKLGRWLRNPVYSGITPEFWGRMDGVGDERTWRLWGVPNCGKGQPLQTIGVGHGAPVARFRKIKVGGFAMTAFDRKMEALSGLAPSLGSEIDTEIIVTESENAVTRIANSEIHQNVAERNTEVTLRVVEKGRAVVVQGNDASVNGVRESVKAARNAARLVPPLDIYPGLSRPATFRETHPYDPAIARFTATRRAEWAEVFVSRARADRLTASGAITASRARIGYLNSRGVQCAADASRVSAELILYDEAGSGFSTESALSGARMRPEAIAEDAAWRAVTSRNPVAMKPGEYEVLLEPPAVADLLDFIGWVGFNAKMLEDHQSFLEDTLGKRAVSSFITIVEDPFSRENPGLPFDFEGTPRQRVTLIDAGMIKTPVYDRRTAKKAGKRSTGNALPPNYDVGPLPLNMQMKAGNTPRKDLIRNVKRGLLVTRFHYTNIVEPRKLILTGMTRDGTFEIRDGEIARGVKNLRFTQNVIAGLKTAAGVSRERRLVSSWFSGTLAPALLLNSFRFTSATLF